ncbi:hypothetical protein MKW98_026611 [Papaver atlanticum]|uniref:Uncharacterized protein n=1 Tax=Papaver atlanticum TaxID=357466 RepID=A0AAD4RZZ7_9MAGN|nr:hypothetical protein MKW98_026611 [Papaver atlanticum]
MEGVAVPVEMTPITDNDNIIKQPEPLTYKQKLIFLPFTTAVIAVPHSRFGAAEGALFRGIANYFSTRLISPRSFAVLEAVNGGMIHAMERIREKDDTKARAVAGFTSGFMFYLVGNMPSPHRVPRAIGTGLIFALGNGLTHEVQRGSEPPTVEDTHYTRTRCIDLEKAGIPLGARKLILNHIERDPDLRNVRGS